MSSYDRDDTLDLIRGVSALAVMAGHLRAFLLVDLGEVLNAGVGTKVFYLATGLGHQAVMVFFVLSGFFVGGSVVRLMREGRFSWKRYGVTRLSRLWVVLIPALGLTFMCDIIGKELAPSAYAGGWRNSLNSGPEADGISLSPITALGNAFFLQTVSVPVFGTNSPLWSLANEFWYYLLFPLGGWALLSWKTPVRAIPAAMTLCLLLVWWLPAKLVGEMGIWLFGTAAWLAASSLPALARWRPLWQLIGGVAFCLTLAGSKLWPHLISDLAVGGTFAIWLPALTGPWSNPPEWLRKTSRGLAEISFTLYVTHFPLLFLAVAVGLGGRQWMPDSAGLMVYFAFLAGTMIAAAGWWWCFERRTERMRCWALRQVELETAFKRASPSPIIEKPRRSSWPKKP